MTRSARRVPASLPPVMALLVLALLAASCSLVADDPDPTASDETPSDAAPPDAVSGDESDGESEPGSSSESGAGDGASIDIEASFAEGDCEFVLPTDTDPRCGTVTVPENWATGDGEIELAVAMFPSTATDPAPDPVVYLEGGPGGHALETMRFIAGDLLEPLQARGDVVFFDQRGAGLSTPSLACPELTELSRELEDAPELDDEEANERFHRSLGQCRDRLTADGIDLGAYTSINNAHDVEAIRVALGYEQWNLHGISYGTKLGLEVLRQHPAGVRSVILDSVFPPQVDSARDNPATFLASYEAVVAACGAEPECAEGGDLGTRLAAVAQAYEAAPVEVEVRDFLTGTVDTVFLEGDTIVGIVNQALYSPLAFTDLPELVAELEQGELAAVESYLSQQRTNEPFFTSGMFYAIECNEEIPFADFDEVEAALPPDPFGLDDAYNYASNNGTNAFSTCEAFGSVPAADASNEPVVSEIPALVMAGRFDPVTPVSWAEAAAENLANSHLVVDPHDSHGVSPGICGMAIVVEFLDDLASRPDTSCLDEGSVRFLTPPDGSVTLETVIRTGSGGSSVTTVRPEGWTHGDLPGDSYRQASFLDPTQIIQVANDPLLRIGLEFYLDETFDVQLARSVERPDLAGRDWTQRSGRTETTAVEWYETEIDGSVVFVILVSTPAELQANIDSVLLPALEGIAVV